MVAIFSENWERGTNGSACTRANTNFADFIRNWTFSNAHLVSAQGSLGGHLVSTASANAQAQVTLASSSPTLFISFPLYPVSAPGATAILANLRGSAAQLADLVFTTDRRLAIRNSGFVIVAQTATNAIPLNAQGRVQWMLNTTTDQQRLQWYSNPTGSAPDYDSGLINTTAVGSADTFNLGTINKAVWEAYIGDVVIDSVAWPSFGGGGGGGGSGTVAYRAGAAAFVSSTSTGASVTMPTTGSGGTPVAGDFAVLWIVTQGGPTQTGPAGWSHIAQQNSSNFSVDAWTKTLVSGDLGATLTVTSTNAVNFKRALGVDIFTGAQLGDVAANLDSTLTGSHTCPPVTAIDANAWILNVVGDKGSPPSSAFTLPGNLTQHELVGSTTSGAVAAVSATDTNVGTGPVGANTITGTDSAPFGAGMLTVSVEPTTATVGQQVTTSSDQTVEPWAPVSFSATANGSPTSIAWSQVTPITPALTITGATTLTPSIASVPAATSKVTYRIRCTATYAGGSAFGDFLLTVLPATEWWIDPSGIPIPIRSSTVA